MRPLPRLGVACSALVLLLAASGAAQNLSAHEGLSYGVTPSTTALIDGTDGGAGWISGWRGNTQSVVGLATYWSLDGGGLGVGLVQNNGVAMAGASYSSTVPVPPTSIQSLRLASTQSQYMDLTAGVGSYANFMRGTISLWFQTSGEARQVMLSASNSSAPSKYVSFGIHNGRVFFEVRGDLYANLQVTQSAPGYADGSWHHAAVVVAGDGVATIYVDGTPSGTSKEEGFFGHVASLDAMSIGRLVTSQGAREHFDGMIDEVAVWGSALSAAEISSLAGGAMPSFAMGPSSPVGPTLRGGSLTSPAYGSLGLSSDGDRYSDDTGDRAWRLPERPVSLRQAGRYYISFLARRDDLGGSRRAGRIQFADTRTTSCIMGWRDDGKWIGGLQTAGVGVATPAMQDQTTYFLVARVTSRGLVTAPAHEFEMKVYGPSATVHAFEEELSGVGPQQNQWTVRRTQSGGASAGDTLWVLHSGTGAGRMEIDEIRIGRTWDSVTNVGFGASCHGIKLGRTGRPALGSTFNMDVSGLAPSTAATLMVGRNTNNWLGNSLPMNLRVYGALGCWLHVAPEGFVTLMTDGAGRASAPLFARNNPAWLGVQVYAQWAGFDPNVPSRNPLPYLFSSATEIVFER